MDWYQNLALPAKFEWDLLTLWSAAKLCVSIKSIVLIKCTSVSFPGLTENSGLKCDQFMVMGAGNTGCGSTGCIVGTIGSYRSCCGNCGICSYPASPSYCPSHWGSCSGAPACFILVSPCAIYPPLSTNSAPFLLYFCLHFFLYSQILLSLPINCLISL